MGTILTGQYYKAKRRNLKLSQTEVAKGIGVSRYTLARYETGKVDIPITVAIRLAIYFDEPELY